MLFLKVGNMTKTTGGNKLLSGRTIKALLIGLILITGPSLVVDYMMTKSIRKINFLSGNVAQIIGNLTKTDSIEESNKMEELDTISAQLDEILSLPLFERIYSHIPENDINSVRARLYSDPGNIIILYQVSFSIKDAIRIYRISLEKTDKYYIILKIIIFPAIFLLVVMFLFKQHFLVNESILKDNFKTQSLDMIEKERNLLAFEFHDNIAQKLSIIGRTLEEGNYKQDKEVLLSAKYTRELLDTVRVFSTSLRTPENLYENLDASLNKLCTDFSIYSHLNLHCRKMGMKALSMTPDNARHLYRIIQESLNNAHKHSHARSIRIFILYSHPKLTVRIKDDGRGFDLNNLPVNGLGLDSIKYRLELLNAQYELKSEINKGTELRFEIHMANEENTNS